MTYTAWVDNQITAAWPVNMTTGEYNKVIEKVNINTAILATTISSRLSDKQHKHIFNAAYVYEVI